MSNSPWWQWKRLLLPYASRDFKAAFLYTADVREPAPDVVNFYDRHPINEAQVLESAGAGGAGGRALAPEDLWRWDQDHYGGLAAVEALAHRAALVPAWRCSTSARVSADPRGCWPTASGCG
jgi:hypothetical protein